jgi:hypothetical protein
LRRVARTEERGVVLGPIEEGDTGLRICAGIFGFEPEQTLPLYGGLNEFLSAVLATRMLQPHLRPIDLLAIVSCIEATIPFRGARADGRGSPELLAKRVREVCNSSTIDCTDADIERIVADAVLLANRDVASFAEPDPGMFLSATWQLIEESNAPLAAVGVYSIQEYRGALSRMEAFLRTLDPNHIFHRYKDTPGDEAFTALCAAAKRNLKFAGDYLGVKLLGIVVIEALALATGGNAPVSMFLGDIKATSGKPDRVEDFLPPPPTTANLDPQLLAVLEEGRTRAATHDLTESPLTAFIYRSLGPNGTVNALEQSKKMLAGDLRPHDFLKALDRQMVRAVTKACAQIAVSRSEALLALERTL